MVVFSGKVKRRERDRETSFRPSGYFLFLLFYVVRYIKSRPFDEKWARDQLLAPGHNTWPTTTYVDFRNASFPTSERERETTGDMDEFVA